ncbi:MAG: hypothetical protein JW838_00855 [Spirochaetes bacterium]|nr:hypothetical protein [Spirochaetota bacterium]
MIKKTSGCKIISDKIEDVWGGGLTHSVKYKRKCEHCGTEENQTHTSKISSYLKSMPTCLKCKKTYKFLIEVDLKQEYNDKRKKEAEEKKIERETKEANRKEILEDKINTDAEKKTGKRVLQENDDDNNDNGYGNDEANEIARETKELEERYQKELLNQTIMNSNKKENIKKTESKIAKVIAIMFGVLISLYLLFEELEYLDEIYVYNNVKAYSNEDFNVKSQYDFQVLNFGEHEKATTVVTVYNKNTGDTKEVTLESSLYKLEAKKITKKLNDGKEIVVSYKLRRWDKYIKPSDALINNTPEINRIVEQLKQQYKRENAIEFRDWTFNESEVIKK